MVVDASVLVDMCVSSRPRHSLALELARHIKTSNLRVTVPMHAILEVKCAIESERKTPGHGDLDATVFTEDDPLRIRYIAIDNRFIQEYVDLSVPYIRAGDLPYVLIAKKHGCALITEDSGQYEAAKQAGVRTYRIDEYLKLIGLPA